MLTRTLGLQTLPEACQRCTNSKVRRGDGCKLYGTLIAACCPAGCDHASSQTLDRSDAAAHSDSGHAEHSDANSLTVLNPT